MKYDFLGLFGISIQRRKHRQHASGEKAIGGVSHTRNDSGGASRFFYCAKVSRTERGVSAHPFMKPIKLCTYLARLILSPSRADGKPRRLLVPYSGSGSEMIGALEAGWDEVVGIEVDETWVETSRARLKDR